MCKSSRILSEVPAHSVICRTANLDLNIHIQEYNVKGAKRRPTCKTPRVLRVHAWCKCTDRRYAFLSQSVIKLVIDNFHACLHWFCLQWAVSNRLFFRASLARYIVASISRPIWRSLSKHAATQLTKKSRRSFYKKLESWNSTITLISSSLSA